MYEVLSTAEDIDILCYSPVLWDHIMVEHPGNPLEDGEERSQEQSKSGILYLALNVATCRKL
jgi:hypothetical protein